MTYQIEISPTAIKDVETIFLWLKTNSPNNSYRWVRGCYEIMLKLEKFPKRCPLALESQYLDIEVRQLFYQNQYKILFTVIENREENSGTVQIHRVRHGSQQIMKTLDQFFSEEET